MGADTWLSFRPFIIDFDNPMDRGQSGCISKAEWPPREELTDLIPFFKVDMPQSRKKEKKIYNTR